MGFFDEWMKGKSDPRKLSAEAIANIDRYDRQDLERITAEMRQYRLSKDRLIDFADTGERLASDTVYGFHKVDNSLKPVGQMKPQFLINHRVQEELRTTQEWERLRTWTEGDIVSSAMAFVTLEEDLEALYDRTKKQAEQACEMQKRMEEIRAAQEGQRTLDEMIEDWQNREELSEEQLAELAALQQAIQQSIDQSVEQAQQANDDMEKAIEQALHGCMPAIRQTMADAADEAEQLDQAMRSWGQDPGEIRSMDVEERLKLAQRLCSPQFKDLTELIGRFTRVAFAEKTRQVYHSFEEVYDVEIGNDLSRLTASELVSFGNPILKRDFYRRYTEQALQQYAMRGTEKVGKGGVILCMDNSGSMQGEPERWAKAVGLATASVCREQKRSFYGIHFSSRGQLKAFDFSTPEKMTLEALWGYAEHFFNGGTDFVTPLTAALRLLQEEEKSKGFVEGDIAFVTDGICHVPPEWLADFKREQERLGFKVWGFMVGGYRESEPLWTICDHHVVTITDLLNPDPVREFFRDL